MKAVHLVVLACVIAAPISLGVAVSSPLVERAQASLKAFVEEHTLSYDPWSEPAPGFTERKDFKTCDEAFDALSRTGDIAMCTCRPIGDHVSIACVEIEQNVFRFDDDAEVSL